ncbi:hypothetical protein HDZ31DRAFT_66191 [Schizophyllum fasciatum]
MSFDQAEEFRYALAGGHEAWLPDVPEAEGCEMTEDDMRQLQQLLALDAQGNLDGTNLFEQDVPGQAAYTYLPEAAAYPVDESALEIDDATLQLVMDLLKDTSAATGAEGMADPSSGSDAPATYEHVLEQELKLPVEAEAYDWSNPFNFDYTAPTTSHDTAQDPVSTASTYVHEYIEDETYAAQITAPIPSASPDATLRAQHVIPSASQPPAIYTGHGARASLSPNPSPRSVVPSSTPPLVIDVPLPRRPRFQVPPCKTIFFTSNGAPPRVKDIAKGRVVLDGAEDPVFADFRWVQTQIEIDIPRLLNKRHTLRVKEEADKHITRDALARHLASDIREFLREGKLGKHAYPFRSGIIPRHMYPWPLYRMKFGHLRLVALDYFPKAWVPRLTIEEDVAQQSVWANSQG